MVYVKSLLAGIAAIIIAAVVSLFVMSMYVYVEYKPAGNEAIGWDPLSLLRPATIIIAICIFAVGFIWEFRRAATK